jgi:HPt (histidine-containing phosphotransfer) domain-containing protein
MDMTMSLVNSTHYTNFESFESKKLDVFIQLGKDLEEDVLSQMLSTYFQTTEETVENFTTLFEEKNYKRIAQLAHKLKSSSGQLGLNKLHKLCTDLENFVHANVTDEGVLNPAAPQVIHSYLNLIYEETKITTALLSNFLKAA